MAAAPLYLEPHLSSDTAALLEESDFLHSLLSSLGSPLNIVLPEQIAANLEDFRAALRRHRLSGRIWFAHKANRSSALLRRLAATDAAGVDVASLGELQHAMSCGFTPDRILATGPKSAEFQWLAAVTGCTVSADSTGELERLAELVRRHSLAPVPVLLRLSDFESTGVRTLSRRSRFGISVRHLKEFLPRLEELSDALRPLGAAYHLDTTSLDEKATALEGCLRALEEFRGAGLRPVLVDAGGGFGANYLAHREQWERFTSELTAAVLADRPPMTWGNHGYGLRAEAGTLRGALQLYPAWRPVWGPRYLDALLERPATLHGGRPLGRLLLEHLYDLAAEPGRALLDQCGVTLARVAEVRSADEPDDGALLVRLEAKAGDIALEEHGVLVDPVLIPADGRRAGPPVRTYLFGGLCLESDLVTRREVHLPRAPRAGDLLAFANTAGYCMDFHATRAQQLPPARKVAAWREEEGGSWRWCLDEQYWPTTVRGGTR